MRTTIKFCPLNFKNELREIKNHIKQLPDITVHDDKCLNYCGQCMIQPFSLVNGKNIVCENADELYQKITEQLENLH
ncbi:DUF1450 domain-containing protein [Anaerobacillus alkaliphilus]|uniref:DUF1450 domain-containing protein n=1 Tax=Anaerobacillus alkaliphilus TaxID=1548597 RepID=A0A4Q0VND5_9BACI|nr:DUF1450 domain-containing protein [Anaerobacillus alkaliphilus]RXI96496.1 DUF1450 domain-containing protein [Anaerobacillus alkaliphilus]